MVVHDYEVKCRTEQLKNQTLMAPVRSVVDERVEELYNAMGGARCA
jgi:hypothetical protein